MSKYIELTQGQVAIVDDEDYEYLSQWKWRADWKKNSNTYYALRTSTNPKKTIYMHRLIMKTPDGLEVDHIHHNGLDNRKENLRNVTPSENIINTKRRTTNTTGTTGVSKQKNKFMATIIRNGTYRYLGLFSNVEDAVSARRKAENE